jgi:nucleoside-diphosphate-sugar epimerase
LIVTSTQFVRRPGRLPRHDEDYDPHTVYGRSKVICEQATRQAKLDCLWTIVRPTTIWGPWLFRHRNTLFPLLRRGLYLHPGRQACIRSWGYVGNVVAQFRRLLEAPPERIDRKTYYLGDRPRDLLDWVNGFSLRLHGSPVRIVPRSAVYLLGLAGDAAALAGIRAPITTSRYRSMTEDYLTPMEPTMALLGEPPFSLEEGIEQVVQWLDQPCPRPV